MITIKWDNSAEKNANDFNNSFQSSFYYFRLRGYLYDDETGVEKQDKYLSRMSGLIRMYAAVIQSPLPPGVRTHPHGVAEGWKWVSRWG